MKMTKSQVVALAGAAAALIAFVIAFQARREIARLSGENSQLRSKQQNLQSQLDALKRGQSGTAPLVETEEQTRTGRSAREREVEAARLEAVRTNARLQTELQATKTSLQQLQDRAGQLESSVQRLTAENQRLTAAEKELRESLDATQVLSKAQSAELKSKADRLAQLENQAKRGQDDSAVADRRVAHVASVLRDLEDVNRRREALMTTLQRRFRDLNDAWRANALRADTQRETNGPSSLGLADVARLNSSVQTAEEDLRQLAALNSQAQRLVQKLK